MTRETENIMAELEHSAPEDHVRKFLGLPPAEKECHDPTKCGCPEREKFFARRAEDTLPNSHITLRLHSAERPNHEYELSGAWIGNVEKESADDLGPYFIVQMRPSKFYKSGYRIERVKGAGN